MSDCANESRGEDTFVLSPETQIDASISKLEGCLNAHGYLDEDVTVRDYLTAYPSTNSTKKSGSSYANSDLLAQSVNFVHYPLYIFWLDLVSNLTLTATGSSKTRPSLEDAKIDDSK